eukprot:GCRY01001714.1.p1 GENE.GCRY01001714.1~~GCRY01001714.1.p1  ORF type:complete len:197 (-),score=12.35 GCRY01001714.1:146-736(-)
MTMKVFMFALFLFCGVYLSESSQAENKVVTLDSGNLWDFIDNQDVFVRFHSPKCGACRAMESSWVELSNLSTNKFAVAEVDCSSHVNFQLCRDFNVQRYPSLFFISQGTLYPYKGEREVTKYVQFALDPSSDEKVTCPERPSWINIVRQKMYNFLLPLEEFVQERTFLSLGVIGIVGLIFGFFVDGIRGRCVCGRC